MEKKKILNIHQLFLHPGQFGGTRSYWIAQETIKQGYHVLISLLNPQVIFEQYYQLVKEQLITK